MFSFKNKKNYGGFTREEKRDIDITNKYFTKKITRQGSCYKNSQWEKDFKKSQYFKRNICEFPNIDFFKTVRNCQSRNEMSKCGKYTMKNQKKSFSMTRLKDIYDAESQLKNENKNKSEINVYKNKDDINNSCNNDKDKDGNKEEDKNKKEDNMNKTQEVKK